jgi:phage N-6-adenine-methyltransferase
MKMEITTLSNQNSNLPSLIDRASAVLASARSSAEILEAREIASFAYDMAKRSARLQRAKQAHDDLIAATHRAQADALEIEALAKRRLADEYDAAQERGEVGKRGDFGGVTSRGEDTLTVADIGLTHKDIYEARQIRDAEEEQPGIVRETLDKLLAEGQEPTRAALTNEIKHYRGQFTGKNEWYTPAQYIEMARSVMGGIDVDPASNEFAQNTVKAAVYYTEENDGLSKEWRGNVWINPPYSQPEIVYFTDKLVEEVGKGNVTSAIILTHNSTDTAWFQKLAQNAAAICFTRGRVKFEGANGEVAAPVMGQAFCYFGYDVGGFNRVFSEIGFVVEVIG